MFTQLMKSFSRSFSIGGLRKILLILIGFFGLGLILTGCPTTPESEPQTIHLETDQSQYSVNDSIVVTITNDSTAAVPVWLHCGMYPEFVYQQQESGDWSGTKQFWYVNSTCPSKTDSLLPQRTFQATLSADWFEGAGTFRLMLDAHYTNSFRIGE